MSKIWEFIIINLKKKIMKKKKLLKKKLVLTNN